MKSRGLACVLLVFLLLGCEKDSLYINSFELQGAQITYDNSNDTAFLTLAVTNMRCSHEKAENLMRMSDITHQIMASHPETGLILFGESINSYYYIGEGSSTYIREQAESWHGPTMDSIRNWAESYNIYIAAGLPFWHHYMVDTLVNRQVVVGPEGQVVAWHDKKRLTSQDQEIGYHSYENHYVKNINGFRCALMIGADAIDEWMNLELLNDSLDVLLHSSAASSTSTDVDAIARRHGAWHAFANRTGNEDGTEFSGYIYISDPLGYPVKKHTGEEAYITYEISK